MTGALAAVGYPDLVASLDRGKTAGTLSPGLAAAVYLGSMDDAESRPATITDFGCA